MMPKRNFLLALLLYSFSLWAESPMLTFDSEDITYHGNVGILNGQNVTVEFRDGSKLCCRFADFSYNDWQGTFQEGIHGLPDAQYTGLITDHEGIPLVLTVSSHMMRLKMKEQKQGSSCYIRSIQADDQVKIAYHDSFSAFADHATYECLFSEEAKVSEIFPQDGVIHLIADQESKPCRITDSYGSEIRSPKVQFYPALRQIVFEKPVGTLKSIKGESQKVDFNADHLVWQEDKGILTLQDNVQVDVAGFGQIKAKEKVQLEQTTDGTKQLQKCFSAGETQLNYVDETKGLTHILTGYGQFIVDHQQHRVWMESPKENGQVVKGKQVSFQDYMGAIFADELTVDYAYDNNRHKLTPKFVKLEGHVRMHNRFSGENAKSSSPLEQYALADIVTYDPATKEMVMSAYPKKRVLFFDKINNIQVSAPALSITRDPVTKKEAIKGKGDVRFTFAEPEMEQLRHQFGEKTSSSPRP